MNEQGAFYVMRDTYVIQAKNRDSRKHPHGRGQALLPRLSLFLSLTGRLPRDKSDTMNRERSNDMGAADQTESKMTGGIERTKPPEDHSGNDSSTDTGGGADSNTVPYYVLVPADLDSVFRSRSALRSEGVEGGYSVSNVPSSDSWLYAFGDVKQYERAKRALDASGVSYQSVDAVPSDAGHAATPEQRERYERERREFLDWRKRLLDHGANPDKRSYRPGGE